MSTDADHNQPHDRPLKMVIIGASGSIGTALTEHLSQDPQHEVFALSRSTKSFSQSNVQTLPIRLEDEESIQEAAHICSTSGPIDWVIVATGLLHDDNMKPEKSLDQLTSTNLQKSFLVNTIGPAMFAKHFLPFLNRVTPSRFAVLSARVGSISDNRLGGWYSYRASKAALNMMIKTLSLETKRKNKLACVVGLHPGTVNSPLSQPFQTRVPKEKLFKPEFSASQLITILNNISEKDTGKIFAWDGLEIPY